jgi:hypothetical protein
LDDKIWDDDLDVENDEPIESEEITEVIIEQVKKKLNNTKRVPILKELLTDTFKAGETKMITMDSKMPNKTREMCPTRCSL